MLTPTTSFRLLLSFLFAIAVHNAQGKADNGSDYRNTPQYLTLRDSLHHAFNDGDSLRFFTAVGRLENYLLQQGDLHAYYTQRCNEIVFQLNRERVFEAYKLAKQLSRELAERRLDKEMYMAINMMGHIYRYSGNKDMARHCFRDVINRMRKEGYTESMPPIYMNLVNIEMEEDPQAALRLIDTAVVIAGKTSPERVFDIEARRALVYYKLGDMDRFLQGYHSYKEGEAKGLSSVHGRSLEIYYKASQGLVDEAVRLASESDDDPYETMADVYASAGRWREAYDALKLGAAESDSINSVILSGSMQGIQEELERYEVKRREGRMWFYSLSVIVVLLLMLVVALVYIVQSRRRHLRQMQRAYDRILESEKMKTAFIQNVSHEVRTPLNIISGFAQVIANPSYDITPEERRHIASAVMHNTHVITTMINEVLDMSDSDAAMQDVSDTNNIAPLHCNEALRNIIDDMRRSTERTEESLRMETTLSDDFVIPVQEHMLRRVVSPLLDNAIKNTSPDGTVVLRAQSADDGRLMLFVEDDGCGVPAAEAEHIFERFVKLDAFKEGLGLGLTFSRTMARRMDGDVWLDTSYEGPGARFVALV